MSTKIWIRKNVKGVNNEGHWYEPKDSLVGLEPVVDGSDHFGFKDPKGHQMMVYRVYMEPASRSEPEAGPCLHLCFYCPDCEAIGERSINMNGKVRVPCSRPEESAETMDKLLLTQNLREAENRLVRAEAKLAAVEEHVEA